MEEMTPVREERLKQVYFCVDGAGDAGASVQDVAKCLEMSVTPYLRDMLDQCVQLGWMRKEQSIIKTGRGARMGWRYYIVPAAQ